MNPRPTLTARNARGEVTIFFLVSLVLHCGLFLFFNYLYQQERTKAKLITGVELLDLAMPRTIRVTVPKRRTSLLQALKTRIFHRKPTKIEKPMDVMKKLLRKATELKKEKLVDKTDPLLRKMKNMDLDALKRKRDEKLVELTKMAKGSVRKVRDLISLEAKLTERKSPLHRLGKATILEDVGMRRSTESIAGIYKIAAAAKQRRKAVRMLSPLAKLEEKKERIRRVLSASSAILDIDKSGSQERELGVHGLQEFVATKKERRTARELLSMQEIIREREDSGGARGSKTKILALLGRSAEAGVAGGGSSLSAVKFVKNIEPVKVIKKAAPSSILEKLKKLRRLENLSKVKEKPVEISGPIKDREIVSAYLPVYPEWAQKSEIEADVTLHFFVTPEGRVKDVIIEKTSGYRKLDQLTIQSLLNWFFVPLGKGGHDQWGRINFKFRLE